MYETQTYQLSIRLDEIASRFCAENPGRIELHGSPMFQGKGKFWRRQPRAERIRAMQDALRVLADSNRNNRIFAVVVEEGATEYPMGYAFEQLASRFDYYLGRKTRQYNRAQRGMVLFDKSAHEERIQSATAVYRNEGHRWGRALKCFAEVPAFIDSRSSRLIQLADIVAYAINRKIARNDEQFYKIIESRFDSADGKIHGLHIKRAQSGVDSF